MIKGLLISSTLLLAATDVTGYTTPFGTMGITGLLAWYIIYDVRYTRPANEARLERMSTLFTDSLREERELRHKMLDKFQCKAE
jgi:hypothetical protein